MIYTVVTFLIFMGILAYAITYVEYEKSLSDSNSISISSQRIFHSWISVKKGVQNLMNVSTAKNESVFEVNDTLPSEGNIPSLLGEYGSFVSQYFADKTIDIHFEDTSGNRIEPETISPKITLSPMNITYGWDSWGKNEMEMRSPVSSLGYIYAVNLTINFVNETIANNSVTWSPYKDCRSNYPCLLLYVYISDGAKTITSAETTFDLSRGSKTDLVYCASNSCWLRIRTGAWAGGDPQSVLKIELQNLNITANTKIKLNTTGFYANFPAKLFVGTDFARKLDYI